MKFEDLEIEERKNYIMIKHFLAMQSLIANFLNKILEFLLFFH